MHLRLRKAAATAAKLERLFEKRQAILGQRIAAIEEDVQAAAVQVRAMLHAHQQKPPTTEAQDATSN